MTKNIARFEIFVIMNVNIELLHVISVGQHTKHQKKFQQSRIIGQIMKIIFSIKELAKKSK